MAVKSALNVFQHEVARAHLRRTAPIAVAVSGGCDSMALLWMAKQVFDTVVGITVDHGLRSTSSVEAVQVGKLAGELGVKHQVLAVDWEGPTPVKKIQLQARLKRYEALLKFCEASSLSTLMTAHHLDDQIETMVYRMSKGSSIDGMAGMYTLSRRASYSKIQLFRPLLRCRKEALKSLCEEVGLEWIEDETNASDCYSRNYIRKLIGHDPALQGLLHMHNTLSNARKTLNNSVSKLVLDLPTINSSYGYLSFSQHSLLKHPQPVVRRVLATLLKYVSSDNSPVKYEPIKLLSAQLANLQKTTMLHKCFVFSLPKENRLAICPASLSRTMLTTQPIEVGKPLLWDKRWEIKLFLTQPMKIPSDKKYFVRHFQERDYKLGRHGIRAIKSSKLPPAQTRTSLPVIVDEKDDVALIPHFKYVNWDHGLKGIVKYKPQLSIDLILQDQDLNSLNYM